MSDRERGFSSRPPLAGRVAPQLHIALLAAGLLGLAASASASQPIEVGYRDFNYGPIANSTPTGEKPESKLWWADGIWWGALWDSVSGRYEIHRFDPATQSWISTEAPLDNRSGKVDVLWDGTHLYSASHVFTTNPGPTVPANSGRLHRLTYNPGTKTYASDPGFPVVVNGSKSEILVLEKDSTGKLWVVWAESGKVKINRTLGSDTAWGTPFDLPTQSAAVDTDDVASIVAFAGNQIGVMWSNQLTQSTHFSVHTDSRPDQEWQPAETVLSDPSLGMISDDHINLKSLQGIVYAVTKTNLQLPTQPLVLVNRRDVSGHWSHTVFGTKAENHTRPILLLDPDHAAMTVLAASDATGREVIYRKTAKLSTMQFPLGLGVPFISSTTDLKVGNVTSTKQNLSSASGLLAIASDQVTHFYFHNFLPTLPTTSVDAPDAISAMPHVAPARPNPFRFTTWVRFQVPMAGHVRLGVYDVLGRLTRSLLDSDLDAGAQGIVWDGLEASGQRAADGVYFIRLETARGTAVRGVVKLH